MDSKSGGRNVGLRMNRDNFRSPDQGQGPIWSIGSILVTSFNNRNGKSKSLYHDIWSNVAINIYLRKTTAKIIEVSLNSLTQLG